MLGYKTDDIAIEVIKNLASYLKSKIVTKCNGELKNNIEKLADHIELEFYRLQLFQTVAESARNDIEKAKGEAEKAERAATSATIAANEALDEAKNFKKDLVAILGILAAILIGSVGAMTFSSKIFDNMEKMAKSEFLFGVGFVSLFFVVVLCMMFSFLRELTERRRSGENKISENFICKRLKDIAFWSVCVLVLIFAAFVVKSYVFNENKNNSTNSTTNVNLNVTTNVTTNKPQ